MRRAGSEFLGIGLCSNHCGIYILRSLLFVLMLPFSAGGGAFCIVPLQTVHSDGG